MTDNISKASQVHHLSLDHYLPDKSNARVDQTVDSSSSLRTTDEAYCRAPAESSLNYNYKYAYDMTMVYVSSTVNTEGATYTTAMHNIDGRKLLKDDYCLVRVDGSSLCRSFKMMGYEDGV